MRSSLRLIVLSLTLILGSAGSAVPAARHFAATRPASGPGHAVVRTAAPVVGTVTDDAATVHTELVSARPLAANQSSAAAQVPIQPKAVAPVRKQAAGSAPATVPAAISRPAPPTIPAPASKPAPAPASSRANTGWAALDNAINHIRTYYPGIAHWHVSDQGAWGATDLGTGDIYIAPRTPVDKLLSVVEHEYMHALTGHMYGGYYPTEAAADRLFGQSGSMGLEIEADCMARVDGATWTWYTACTNPAWRATATALLARHIL